MPECALSVKGIAIRLTEERWDHVLKGHPEVAPHKAKVLETLANPECVLEGNQGELLAVSELLPSKWLVVFYREFAEDGFVITALTTRRDYRNSRIQLWP